MKNNSQQKFSMTVPIKKQDLKLAKEVEKEDAPEPPLQDS